MYNRQGFEHNKDVRIQLKMYTCRKTDANFNTNEFLGDRVLNLCIAEKLMKKMTLKFVKGFFGYVTSNKNYNSYCASLNLGLNCDELEASVYSMYNKEGLGPIYLVAEDIMNYSVFFNRTPEEFFLQRGEMIDSKMLNRRSEKRSALMIDNDSPPDNQFNQYCQLTQQVPFESYTEMNSQFECEIRLGDFVFTGDFKQSKKEARRSAVQFAFLAFIKEEVVRLQDIETDVLIEERTNVEVLKQVEMTPEQKCLMSIAKVLGKMGDDVTVDVKMPTTICAVYCLFSLCCAEEFSADTVEKLKSDLTPICDEYFCISESVIIIAGENLDILVRCAMKDRLDIMAKVHCIQSGLVPA